MVMGPEHRKESRAAKVTANAVECERRLVERREVSLALLEKLPSLTEIVVVTDRGLRATMRQALVACEEALAAEEVALCATRKMKSAAAWSELSRELEERREYIKDLSLRASDLFAHSSSVPIHVPVTSKAQIAELLTGLHEYREVFWRRLYEVPCVQRCSLERLRHVVEGKGQPSLTIHRGAVGKPDEEALRREAKEVVTAVDALYGKKVKSDEKGARLSEVAALLMRTPLDPGEFLEQALTLRAKANELADLEITLKCAYRSIHSRAARQDPRFAEWLALSDEFGGGAMVARRLVAGIEAAQEPYVRIKQYITTANYAFVQKLVSMGQRYQSLLGDMIQEGAIGFMRALDKFDPKSGFALLTYAGFWVKQRLSRGYERQLRVVYVPDRLSGALVRLSEDVSGSLRNDPAALAKKIGVKPDDLAALIPFTSHTVSLSSPILGTERILGETISTSGLKEVGREEFSDDLDLFRQRLTAALGTLTHKERDVLTKRFGLDGKGERTLQEIADDVGLTKERIRQIQNRALEYLKNGPAAAELERLVREMGE